tara:strand:- start:16 stop:465 length:450 start_codon:yes stop_codon:yes gene_type:complete
MTYNPFVTKRKKGQRRYPQTYGKGWGQMTDYANGYNDYNKLTHTVSEGHKFYRSEEWIETRDQFKEGKDLKCCKCGSRDHVCVDHKLPLRRFWQYRTHPYNLQLLCHKCNKKKSNYTDYNILREIKDKIRLDIEQQSWRSVNSSERERT